MQTAVKLAERAAFVSGALALPVAPLHLGLILPNYGEGLDAERLAGAAVAAEAAGFDSGWVTDHVLVPPGHAPVYGTIAEALVSLGFLAGHDSSAARGLLPRRAGAIRSSPWRPRVARLPVRRPHRTDSVAAEAGWASSCCSAPTSRTADGR